MKQVLAFLLLCSLLLCWNSACAFELITMGDSLTEGVGDVYTDEGQLGYPGRLKLLLEANYPSVTLHNLGRSGWTTSEVRYGNKWDDRPQSQLNQALDLIRNVGGTGEETATLLWIGSNDIFSICGWYRSQADLDEDVRSFREDLGAILQELSQSGTRVYLGLIDDLAKRPVLASAAYADDFPDITPAKLPQVSLQVASYNEVITQLAQVHGAMIVDFFNTTIFANSATLSEDGNHPNADGYDEIAAIWYQSLVNNSVAPVPSDVVPVPSGQSAWSYQSVVLPVKQLDPADCKPFAVGDISSGNINLQVGLPAFSSGVDVYLALQSDVLGNMLFFIDKGNHATWVTTSFSAWKTGVLNVTDESLFGDIPVFLLSPGLYNLYLAVTPTGGTDFSYYYLWSTSFSISQ